MTNTPNTPQAMRETPDDIIEFLYGAEPFEGVWYGDGKHPTRKGNYWWRSLLRERIESDKAAALAQIEALKADAASRDGGGVEASASSEPDDVRTIPLYASPHPIERQAGELVSVPREPTIAQICGAFCASRCFQLDITGEHVKAIYQAMLHAAPDATAPAQPAHAELAKKLHERASAMDCVSPHGLGYFSHADAELMRQAADALKEDV